MFFFIEYLFVGLFLVKGFLEFPDLSKLRPKSQVYVNMKKVCMTELSLEESLRPFDKQIGLLDYFFNVDVIY